MYIPGQIRIFDALKSDGYSTGNAPPSGNNTQCRDFRVGKHSSCPLWNIAPQMDHKVVFNVKHINPVAIT